MQSLPNTAATHSSGLEPILVNVQTAQHLLGVGNTKFWRLVKQGQIEVTSFSGGRTMVKYASLKRLGETQAA